MRFTRLLSLACAALVALSATAPGVDAQGLPPAPDTGSYLYRFVIVQAAPGKLLDLIELYRSRMAVIAGSTKIMYEGGACISCPAFFLRNCITSMLRAIHCRIVSSSFKWKAEKSLVPQNSVAGEGKR